MLQRYSEEYLEPCDRKLEHSLLTMPVRELITAAPPVNSIAVTRILVMIPKTAKTLKC